MKKAPEPTLYSAKQAYDDYLTTILRLIKECAYVGFRSHTQRTDLFDATLLTDLHKLGYQVKMDEIKSKPIFGKTRVTRYYVISW